MTTLAVIPVLVGPLQALLAILPGILVAMFGVLISVLKPRTMLTLLKLVWRLKLYLLIVTGCIAAVIYGSRRMQRAAGTAAAMTGGADWTMFRGGASRTGVVPGEAPARGGVQWRWERDQVTFHASPCIVGNRAYIVSVEDLSYFNKDGRASIYCFDVATGTLVWQYSPTFTTGAKQYRGTFSSPVVKGSHLVCGEGLHFTANCRVICLDIGDETNVRLAWSHETDNHVECTPVIGEVALADGQKQDRVFVGNGDTGGYYCFDLKTGNVIWHLGGDKYPDAETSLVYHGNRLYAGLGNDGKAVCAIDAVTGAELCRVETGYPVFSPAAVADGKLFIGMGNGDFINSAAALGLESIGEVWCLDTGRLDAGGSVAPDWKVTIGETILGAIAVSGDSVFFASVDGRVYHVDRKNGAVRNIWSAHSRVASSPAVSDELVYVLTADGMLYGLDREGLAPIWELRLGEGRNNFSSPAVAAGHIYAGTEKSGIVCAGEPGRPAARVWPGRLAGPEKGGNYFGSAPPALGQLEWFYPECLDGDDKRAFVAAPVAVMGDRMLVPIAEAHDGFPAGIRCIPTQSVSPPEEPLWEIATSNGVSISPAIAGEIAMFADGEHGECGRRLHGVSLADGTPLWTIPLAPNASGRFVAAADQVFVQDQVRQLSAWSLDGKKQWATDVGGPIEHLPDVTASMIALAVSLEACLVVLDRQTGAELQNVELAGAPRSAVHIKGGTAYVGTTLGLEAWDLVTGSVRAGWTQSGHPVSGDVAILGEQAVYVSEAGELVIVGLADGTLAAAPLPKACPGTAPLVGQDRVLYVTDEYNINTVAIGGELTPREWWEDGSVLGGQPTTPMVLAGSSVYIGWPGWGLVRLGAAR